MEIGLLDEKQNPIKDTNPLPVKETSAEAILAALVEKASEVTAAAILAKLNAGISTTLTGSSLDLRGLAANKPLATAVQIGTTYWSVDTDPNADAIEVSNGTDWSVMA